MLVLLGSSLNCPWTLLTSSRLRVPFRLLLLSCLPSLLPAEYKYEAFKDAWTPDLDSHQSQTRPRLDYLFAH